MAFPWLPCMRRAALKGSARSSATVLVFIPQSIGIGYDKGTILQAPSHEGPQGKGSHEPWFLELAATASTLISCP